LSKRIFPMELDLQSANPIVPLFLLKTFSILETADPAIVSWSDAGDSFLVIDADRFGSEVIPTHFKHNKFSSFVRQLNFYGFRKVKGKLNFVGKSEQHSWEFKHPAFLRGKPELLTHIKRSSSHSEESAPAPQTAAALSVAQESSVVQMLNQQVLDLTFKMEVLTKSVKDLHNIVAQYQKKTGMAPAEVVAPPALEEVTDGDASSVADNWDIGDDELLMTFLEDLNDGPLAPVGTLEQSRSLKRARSVDSVSDLLEQPVLQTARTDADVVRAVASAVAGGSSEASHDQYVAAIAAILSCSGMSQAQALATSAAVLARTQTIQNQNQVQPVFSQQSILLSL